MKMTKLELKQLAPEAPPIQEDHGAVEVSEIVDPYQRGVSINRLSFELKLTEGAIRKTLVNSGIAIRGKSAAATSWAKF